VLHDGSRPWPELDVIKQFVDNIIEQKKDKNVAFEFTGGEVTVYKHFTELCDHIKSRGAAVAFISNGSRTVRWWEEFKGKADHVCLSFHAEEGEVDHFFNVTKLLHDSMKVHVNVMMHPDHWNKCLGLAELITTVPNITLALQPLIHDFGDELFHYEPWQQVVFEEQYKLYQKRIPQSENAMKGFSLRGAMRLTSDGQLGVVKQPHILIAEKANNWAGWSCAAGVEQIIVDLDGSVWRGWCRVGGNIGSIKDPEFKLPVEWITCNKSFCHCNFDIMCTKLEIK
jgi:organic radical activating enzyme